MFEENSESVFANIPADYRPDNDGGRPLPQGAEAHVDAVPAQSGIRGVGRSPDGLGRRPGVGYIPGGQGAVGYTGPWEPTDVSTPGAVRTAGITTLLVAVTVGAGLAAAGWKGGISGLLLSGAMFNGYRAQKWWDSPVAGEKHEAVTSAIMTVLGVVSGGYVAYKAYEDKKGR